jgi:hypothetical protein
MLSTVLQAAQLHGMAQTQSVLPCSFPRRMDVSAFYTFLFSHQPLQLLPALVEPCHPLVYMVRI